jgi:hypothetical protein
LQRPDANATRMGSAAALRFRPKAARIILTRERSGASSLVDSTAATRRRPRQILELHSSPAVRDPQCTLGPRACVCVRGGWVHVGLLAT